METIQLQGDNVQITSVTIKPAVDYVNQLITQAQFIAGQITTLQSQLADIQSKITSLTN